MNTYLFAWNPLKWPVEKYLEYIDQYRKGQTLKWSCGRTKKINSGDRFYLIKKGTKDNGLIGSGIITSSPFEDTHYNEQENTSKKALFVNVRFDYLLPPDSSVPIRTSEIEKEPYFSPIWTQQGSGQTIPPHISDLVDELWRTRVNLDDFLSQDEREYKGMEGTHKKIYVNSYERDPRLRQACIDKHGVSCLVCSFHFELNFGEIGKGFIHVHHLAPLSQTKDDHEVDAITDLKPVCPNCHAMLHKRDPPFSIEELKKIRLSYKIV